jgi:competence protein ComEC
VIIAFAAALWLGLWIFAPPGERSMIKESYPDIPIIESLRAAFLNFSQGVTPDSKALVAGLAIGERDLLSDEMTQQMKTLSLTHLVAVSGANLAIVMGAVFLLAGLLGVRRNIRFLIAIAAMVGYVLIVGPESSVLRAATMAMFVMTGIWIGRGTNPMISLSWAIIFLLTVDPGLAVDYGFSLSALATAGLVWLAVPIYKYLSLYIPRWLALGIAASFSAQLFTMPILIMLQPSIPIYSVLANLLVEPVVAPVTILGIIAVVSAMSFPPLTWGLSLLASLGTWWITLVAQTVSSFPLARVHFVSGPIAVVLLTLIALLTGLVITRTDSRRLFGSLLSAVLAVSVGWSLTDLARANSFAGNWSVLQCDVGQGDALLIKSKGVVALIDVGKDPNLIAKCLKTQGVTRIDLLVLTHYDADHVAGITGLSGIEIGQALLSGFKDDRPLVSTVAQVLESAENVSIGHRGLTGVLGDFNFTVLAPSFEASEASDSNDASVVISFRSESLGVLALGDLGEVGQSRLMRHVAGELSLLRNQPLIVKVAHHGSADQSRELYEFLDPEVMLYSVGKNDYGHPTDRALRIASSIGALILRTDKQGSIAVRNQGSDLSYHLSGKLST